MRPTIAAPVRAAKQRPPSTLFPDAQRLSSRDAQRRSVPPRELAVAVGAQADLLGVAVAAHHEADFLVSGDACEHGLLVLTGCR